MILFHYTCAYNSALIKKDDRILPRPQAALGGVPVVWLGDFRSRSPQIRQHLGLDWHGDTDRACAKQDPPCDPVFARIGVLIDIANHPGVHPFSNLDFDFPATAAMYRALPGAMPWRWWYSTAPIKLVGGSQPNV